MELDWEEGVFRGLLSLGRRLKRSDPAPDPTAARLADHRGALTTLARVIAEEPVRVLPARDAGGIRGADLLLPASFALAPDAGTNRALLRLRTAIAARMRRLARSQPPEPVAGAEELASLALARAAVDALCDELPGFAAAWEPARRLALGRRPDASTLRGREQLLEAVRCTCLAGERPWQDPVLVRSLQRARRRRGPRSPEIPLFGVWFPDLAAPGAGSDAAPEAEPTEVSTELPAPAVDALERVEIDREEQQDAVLIHVFEKTQTLDTYQGGARDTDGSDELEDQLEALSEVDLGALVRDDTPTRAALRADLPLEIGVPDVPDAATVDGGIAYDEWDGARGRYRSDWCTVYPARAEPGGAAGAAWVGDALARHRRLHRELRRRLERFRAGLRAAPRQLDGDDVDLEALVDHRAALCAGRGDDPRLYQQPRRRRRDFATTVLLDVSLSSDSWNEGRRVLDVAREAVLLLGEVAHELGDRLQVLSFASETRNRCHVWHLKGWQQPWPAARAGLGALTPRGYTRIGPALRYATDVLAREPAERRLLLLISDGKPTDYDRYEGRYGMDDVRQALREAARRDIHAHALAVDAVARDTLPAMFGPGAWHVMPHPDALPEALATVYGRLTGR